MTSWSRCSIALVLCLSVAGCGGGSGTRPPSTTTTAAGTGATVEQVLTRLSITKADLGSDWTSQDPQRADSVVTDQLNECQGLDEQANMVMGRVDSNVLVNGDSTVSSQTKLYKSSDLAKRVGAASAVQTNWPCMQAVIAQAINQTGQTNDNLSVAISRLPNVSLSGTDYALRYVVTNNTNKSVPQLWVDTVGTSIGPYAVTINIQRTGAAPTTELDRQMLITAKAKLQSAAQASR